jgi:uncharacterized protein (DUF302 family)
MTYYFAKTLHCSFDDAVDRATEALQSEGFGVLTDIDLQATLKKKLDLDTPSYRILGACNPPLAHQALTAEERIGLMLPCNVVVRATADGVEVAAIDPAAAMAGVGNPQLAPVAQEVAARLRRVIQAL